MRSALRTDADIVEGGYSRFVGERTTFTFRHSRVFTRDWSILYGFPVGKVYKSWLFEDVVFPLGYWFEDTICIYLLYPRCKAVATIKGCCLFVSAERTRYHFYFSGNIKTLDALWVTRRLLADSKRMGIPATQALYDMLLLDLSVNLTRFVTLDDMVHQDAFMVSAALLRNIFPIIVRRTFACVLWNRLFSITITGLTGFMANAISVCEIVACRPWLYGHTTFRPSMM